MCQTNHTAANIPMQALLTCPDMLARIVWCKAGLRAARVAWQQAKAEQQAEAGQRHAHQAQVAEQRKKNLLVYPTVAA